MKDTVLTHIHKELGARMVPFAGYNMPLEYSGIKDEHLGVRNAVGIFDVSHMGEIWVKGAGATELVQKLTTNDVKKLYNGKIQYNCFPNGNGGIIDDILVYKYSEEKFMLVVNASNIEKDWNWINRHNGGEVELENSSEKISLLAVQGPRSIDVLQKLTTIDLAKLKYYNFQVASFAGVEEVIISATGYTGAGGFELYFYNPDAVKIWDAIMEAGAEFGIKPAGLAARDTLRLEMGFCLYGNDIDETTSPIEAGLGWICKLTEDNDFIDKDRLLKQKEEGTTRKLIGFKMIDKGIPRQHYEILSETGKVIGNVTSGTMSPMMNIGIGMGYVTPDFTSDGSRILIRVRNKELAAEVVDLPIYKKDKAV